MSVITWKNVNAPKTGEAAGIAAASKSFSDAASNFRESGAGIAKAGESAREQISNEQISQFMAKGIDPSDREAVAQGIGETGRHTDMDALTKAIQGQSQLATDASGRELNTANTNSLEASTQAQQNTNDNFDETYKNEQDLVLQRIESLKNQGNYYEASRLTAEYEVKQKEAQAKALQDTDTINKNYQTFIDSTINGYLDDSEFGVGMPQALRATTARNLAEKAADAEAVKGTFSANIENLSAASRNAGIPQLYVAESRRITQKIEEVKVDAMSDAQKQQRETQQQIRAGNFDGLVYNNEKGIWQPSSPANKRFNYKSTTQLLSKLAASDTGGLQNLHEKFYGKGVEDEDGVFAKAMDASLELLPNREMLTSLVKDAMKVGGSLGAKQLLANVRAARNSVITQANDSFIQQESAGIVPKLTNGTNADTGNMDNMEGTEGLVGEGTPTPQTEPPVPFNPEFKNKSSTPGQIAMNLAAGVDEVREVEEKLQFTLKSLSPTNLRKFNSQLKMLKVGKNTLTTEDFLNSVSSGENTQSPISTQRRLKRSLDLIKRVQGFADKYEADEEHDSIRAERNATVRALMESTNAKATQ